VLAVQIVRNAAVEALAPLHPAEAAKFWAAHPAVETSLGLAAIGRAARERRPIDSRTFAMMDDAAAKAPLAPEPFLVRGVQAQVAGQGDAANRAFMAGQWRDPRSLPAAYFLADYYFRSGHPLEGLRQTVVLARLSPSGAQAAAPFVAAFAQQRSNWPLMRQLFRSESWLEASVLAALARDPRNTEAILALADADHRKPGSDWLPVLLSTLVANGDYARARALWSSIGGGQAGALLFDPGFSAAEPPAPFNWSLASSTIGLAERQPGGRLHLIFYGNVDGVLASELVMLPPGAYHMQLQLVGSPVHPEALQWAIRCDKSAEPVAIAAVDDVASRGWTFQIPANCPAQWLELSGRSGDVAQQSDVTITGLKLDRAGADA
jgi:hypothetical protein